MTDHVKDQLCQRIEELEAEKMELNEQLDALQEECDSYQHQFARATEVLGEIHEALNGSGPAIVGMEAAQVRQLQGERDALAAHVESLIQEIECALRIKDLWLPSHCEPEHEGECQALEMMHSAFSRVVVETPETSLARLKAKWQAEGGEA